MGFQCAVPHNKTSSRAAADPHRKLIFDRILSRFNAGNTALGAYQYDYPLVLEATTAMGLFFTQKGTDWNKFWYKRDFLKTNEKGVVRPNLHTLYSIAFLDLEDDPIRMGIPAIKKMSSGECKSWMHGQMLQEIQAQEQQEIMLKSI